MNCAQNMPRRVRPTEEDGKQSLLDHAAEKAMEARQLHGQEAPGMSLEGLEALLEDRRFVRYPVRLAFEDGDLQDGEFAFARVEDSDDLSKGFVLIVRPCFEGRADVLPFLVAYHLVCVNYGEVAGSEAAEVFGAALMGIDVESYYQKLCQVADTMCSGNS